ncbi:hypothetical protein HDV00_003723 [Rhizophlyctis rosea]|nr:hypothetical protein HDV00_003723 [Rhizophlyctis rosea]
MSTKRKQPPAEDVEINIMDDDDHNQLRGESGQGYAWEEEYKRSWDVLQEDEQGSLQGVVASLQQQMKRRRLHRDAATVQRGIIRHVYLGIDMSTAMVELDLKPSRLECSLNLAEQFINEYFDQNPLSQLGVILTRNGLAEKITELSGNPSEHIEAIRKKENRLPQGEPSLQNMLELARTSLHHVPSHGSREVLVLYGALTTCDPGNILDTISLLKQDTIRVSMIGLSAEVQICRTICKETNGTYGVVINESHYKDLLFENVPPPPLAVAKNNSNLIKMGFPVSKIFDSPVLCACITSPGHCFSCQQAFPSAPAAPGRRVSSAGGSKGTGGGAGGGGGGATEMGSSRYACPRCHQQYCLDCDIFIHDVLHNCPRCV